MSYYKYPRTPHLPFSLGKTSDDRVLSDLSIFDGLDTIISMKQDGENTSLYYDKYHARSLDSNNHPSRNWVKGLWGSIRYMIPLGWRVCGENLYAKHSIEYTDLESYFMVFSVWDENNVCLSWDETLDVVNMLGLVTVPVINRMVFDEKYLLNLAKTLDTTKNEGFVVRNAGSFSYEDFDKNIAKFVRENHVQSDSHWMHGIITPNTLKKDNV